MRLKTLVAAMCAVSLSPVWAATELPLVSVAETADQKLQPIEITTSSSLSLDKAEQQRNATTSLGAALADLPGVNNLGAGSQSGKPVVRGDTALRLPVLSNGMAMDYQAEGTRHNPNLDPVLADEVEVIRGPSGLKYSSQAVKGAVNVQGLKIDYAAPGKTDFKGEVVGEVNSNNHEHMMGVKAQAASSRLSLVGGVTQREGDNFVTPKGSEAGVVNMGDPDGSLPLVTGETPYTNFKNQAASLGLGYQDDWGKVELRHSYWQSKQNYLGVESDGPGKPYELMAAAGQILTNEETQLLAEWFAGDWVIKPQVSVTRNTREAAHDVPFEEMGSLPRADILDLLVKRTELKLSAEHPEVAGWHGELGVSGFDKTQDLRSGELSPSATEKGQGVFVVEKRAFGKLQIEAGARWDTQAVKAPVDAHFADVYNESNNEQTFADWSGALGAAYPLDAQWTVTANLGRSFRAPSIFELYAGGAHGGVQAYQLGNPNLKAETSVNSELALTFQTPYVHSTFALYSNWVDNYIVLENTGRYRYAEGTAEEGQVANTASPTGIYIPEMQSQQTTALIQGAEWSAKYQMTSRLLWKATAEVMQGRDTVKNRELPLMPAHNASLQANYTFANLGVLASPSLGLKTRYVAEKKSAGLYEPYSQFDKTPFGTASTPDYWLWEAQAGTAIKLGKQALQLDLTVQNLFDTQYRDFLDTYKGYAQGMGRNVKLNLRMPFGV